MNKAWRRNNKTPERSVFDRMLDRIARDFTLRPERREQRRVGGGRRAVKPQRPSFALEAIGPRLLLSADVFTASQAAALTAGLQGLSSWADTLDHSGALAHSLPTYTQSAPN